MVVAAVVLTTAAGAPAPVASAEPGGACQVSDTGRFADCESGFHSWNIRQTNGGEVVGTVDIAFTISEVVSPSSRQWSAHWKMYVPNLTGVAECGGSCSAGTGLPDDGTVLSRNQSLTGDVSFSSPGTGRAGPHWDLCAATMVSPVRTPSNRPYPSSEWTDDRLLYPAPAEQEEGTVETYDSTPADQRADRARARSARPGAYRCPISAARAGAL